MSSIPSVNFSPVAQPTESIESTRPQHASNAAGDAAINKVSAHVAQSLFDSVIAPLTAGPNAPPPDFSKLLLGLIPIAGPLILLADAFSKVGAFGGQGQQNANGSVITDRSNPNHRSSSSVTSGNGQIRGSAIEELRVEDSIEGSFGDEKNGGSGKVTGSASAGVRADGTAGITSKGARAAGGVAAEAQVSVTAEGEVHGTAGRASGSATAYARAHAEAKGTAELDITKGLTVGGQAATGAEAGAKAQVCAETAPLLSFGGYDLKAGAKADGYATSGAGASCNAEATATFNPPEVVGQFGGRAFAGARAGAHASIGTGPFKLDVGIDARAGAGVEYGGTFSFKDGKLEVKGFAGIAAAVGLGTNFNLSIDFNQLGAMVAGIFGQVAMDAPKGSPGQAVAAGISDFVKMATPFVAQAAAEHSNIDLLKGQGGYKEDVTAQTKRDEPSSDLSQKELDARTERDLKRQKDALDRDLNQMGNGPRSTLNTALV